MRGKKAHESRFLPTPFSDEDFKVNEKDENHSSGSDDNSDTDKDDSDESTGK